MPGTAPIFVNTCDAYEDCWHPFFCLLARYWVGPLPRIYLNTEIKTYQHPNLDIVCTRVSDRSDEKRLPWGTLLRRGLAKVNDEIVLYMHEDYFLQAPIDCETLQKCEDAIRADTGIAAIRLQEFGGSGPWSPSEFPFLWEVDRKSPYRVSLQAGLWRKDRMSQFVRSHENPWQFEIWGSKRLRRYRDRILCVNRDTYDPQKSPVLPYPCNDAVQKGRWNKEVVCDLFAANEIDVDFTKRGFLEPDMPVHRNPLPQRVFARARSIL